MVLKNQPYQKKPVFAMYGWSCSLQEMDKILQLDLVPFSDYSEINSSVVIVTNSSAPMVSHL